MPAFLIPLLMALLGSVIARVMLGAGLAFLTFTWVNDLVSLAQNQISGLMGGLPADLLGILGIMQIPQALSIIMSAIGTAAFIKTSKIALGKS